jgi:hypothetical protein
MKPPKPDSLNRPFEALRDLLRREPVPRPSPSLPAPRPSGLPLDEDALFFEAMSGVSRMQWNGFEDDRRNCDRPEGTLSPPENETAPFGQMAFSSSSTRRFASSVESSGLSGGVARAVIQFGQPWSHWRVVSK